MIKTVKILGKKIKIEVSKGMDDHGDFNSAKHLIRLNGRDSKSEREKTLFHELIHASLFIGGINELLTEELEEAIVRNIEHGIFPILKRLNKNG